jgi:uncharacterized protein DUF3592
MQAAFPLCFLLFGAGFLALGFFYVTRMLRLGKRGVRTVGIIRERKESPRSEGGSTLNVTVDFEDHAGTRRQVTTPVITGGISFGRSGRNYEIGDQVPIVYDPQRPTELRINTFLNTWLGPIVVITMGLIFVTASVLILTGVW